MYQKYNLQRELAGLLCISGKILHLVHFRRILYSTALHCSTSDKKRVAPSRFTPSVWLQDSAESDFCVVKCWNCFGSTIHSGLKHRMQVCAAFYIFLTVIILFQDSAESGFCVLKCWNCFATIHFTSVTHSGVKHIMHVCVAFHIFSHRNIC